MTTVQDLQKQFHCCMPLFIALGDKVRLSIVELLTEAAVRSEDPQGTIDFEGHAMNVNEITRRTSLSRPAISHLVGVRQDGTANYYYLTLRDSTRSLMELGYRLEEFM